LPFHIADQSGELPLKTLDHKASRIEDHVRVRSASWLLGAVAIVVCAWFALGARQAIDTQRATAIALRGKTADSRELREVRSLVHGATLLNPDKQPDLLLARVEIEHGDLAQARHAFEALTRSEPQNIEAWALLAAASGSQPSVLRQALRHVHELEPRVQ
jgi:cytochrome c-type biogenesis protein CcmH/NrfG